MVLITVGEPSPSAPSVEAPAPDPAMPEARGGVPPSRDCLPCGAFAHLEPFLLGDNAPARFLAFSSDGRALVSMHNDRIVCRRDPATGEVLHWSQMPSGYLGAASQDGRWVAALDRRANNLFVWDSATGTVVFRTTDRYG
jgi:WD40 repeat protein